MLHASLAGFILAFIYRFLDKKHEKSDEFHAEIDWWMGFAVVFASSIAISGFTIMVASLELSPVLILLSYLLYILIPFVIIKVMLDYKPKKALVYSIWVPLVAIVAEIPFLLLQGVANA